MQVLDLLFEVYRLIREAQTESLHTVCSTVNRQNLVVITCHDKVSIKYVQQLKMLLNFIFINLEGDKFSDKMLHSRHFRKFSELF